MRKIATNENHIKVDVTIIIIKTIRIEKGISFGVIIKENKLRKNKLTFGFKTFVRNPIFNSPVNN